MNVHANMKFRVTSIQRGCVNDGPGVRTVVFLKGCVFRCPWCCNPETQSYEEEIFFDENKCLHVKGVSSDLCDGCKIKSGNRDVLKCPFKVAVPVSKDYTKDELLAEILKDKTLYETSNGGVTFSGGEPLLYAKQLLPLLIELKDKGIHVAIETTLAVDSSIIKAMMPYVDYWCVDLKLQLEMIAFSQTNSIVDNNMRILEHAESTIMYRLVITNSICQKKDMIVQKLTSLNVKDIELLICHNLAKTKYRKLNVKNHDFTINRDICVCFSEYLKNNGVNNLLLG